MSVLNFTIKKHWSLTYFKNKFRSLLYHRLNNDKPWLTKKANKFLEKNLNKQMIGIEFGSGKSTLYLAKKIKKLTSVEHNEEWFNNVSNKLKKNNIENVENYYLPVLNSISSKSMYHNILDNYPDNFFDIVLIDGKNRDLCTLKALNKLKNQGLLVIDNVNRYLPSNSLTPYSVPIDAKPVNQNWEKIYLILQNWDSLWTSSGVSDTAIYIKPSNS